MPNPTLNTETTLRDDLLDGVPAFARFTGFTERRCYYLLERRQLPGGKLGKKWAGSKEVVRQFLANLTGGGAA